MVPDPRSTRTIRPWLARVKRSSLLSMIGIIIVSSVKVTAASDPFLNSRKSISTNPAGLVPHSYFSCAKRVISSQADKGTPAAANSRAFWNKDLISPRSHRRICGLVAFCGFGILLSFKPSGHTDFAAGIILFRPAAGKSVMSVFDGPAAMAAEAASSAAATSAASPDVSSALSDASE